MDRNESPVSSSRKLKLEQLKADYELFLQTFEKPTLIYRYLRVRHALAPIFLHRTLSYLKGRHTTRPNDSRKRRKDVKCVDVLPLKAENAARAMPADDANGSFDEEKEPSTENHLNLRFTGFFHGPNLTEELAQTIDKKVNIHLFDEFVEVDVNLVKIFHKRRKDESIPMTTVSLGSCKAPCNPRTELFNNGPTFAISIPSKVFDETNRSVKTFILSIQLTLNVRKDAVMHKAPRKGSSDLFGHDERGKKQESSDIMAETNLNCTAVESELTTGKTFDRSNIQSIPYSAEMIVFDKHKSPLLANGDYELLLQRTDLDDMPEKENWEGDFSTKLGAFNLISFGPTIKLHLEWDNEPLPGTTKLATPLKAKNGVTTTAEVETPSGKEDVKPQRVFYQFIYSNSTKQQTEAREDYYCPWCAVNCIRLHGLMKHLRLCHARFSFIYTPTTKGARIDVCLNENFDWNSSRRRVIGAPQVAILRGEGPMKQTTETQVLVSKAAIFDEGLAEFLEPEYTTEQGSSSRVDDRVYYRTNSCLPLLPQEMECNSEDEKAPAWIKEKTRFMIDEFSDVNPGEKELTKLWNIHVLSEGFIADFQMNAACQIFVERYGRELVAMRLQRNFLLHLCSLADFGLLQLSYIQPLMASLVSSGNEE